MAKAGINPQPSITLCSLYFYYLLNVLICVTKEREVDEENIILAKKEETYRKEILL